MIDLPAQPAPNGCQPRIISFNQHVRPSTGAAVQPILRPGGRFALDFSFAKLTPADARKFASRLTRAEREGLRMKVPLLGVSQGAPGIPVVDGDYPSGTALPLRSVTPGYMFDEGYWLTLIDAAGAYFLHRVVGSAAANGAGKVTISIETPIRAPFLNGATALVQQPMVQGFVETGSLSLGRAGPDGLVDGFGFTLEEYA